METIKEKIRRYMIITERIDEIYSHFSKVMGMSESELCVLYLLDREPSLSQRQICEQWLIPKTTLNTIIKKYEKIGYIQFEKIPNNRKEMRLRLTVKGKEYAATFLESIYRAEDKAMRETLKKYGDSFIEANECFAEELKSAFEKGLKSQSNGEEKKEN